MKFKKILLGSIVTIFVLGIAGGAYWWLMRPQIIILGDGTELRVLDVTYGKHHKLSKAKTGGRVVRNGGSITTTNNSLCVWVEQKHEQNNWPNYQVLLYDGANTACASETTRSYGNFGNRQGDEVMGFVFGAFPRRGGKMYIHIQEWNNQNGQQDDLDTHFVVHNLAPGTDYPKWTADKLPNTQSDGDLQVTLSRFEIESGTFGNNGTPDDPRGKSLLASYHIEQNGILVTNWQPVSVVTTDATGNAARNRSTSNRQDKDEEVLLYQWGLWPNEPAWKTRVEMSRTSGFHTDEMWTVSAIPVTNLSNMNEVWNPPRKSKPFAETKLGESQVQIYAVGKLSEEVARSYGNMEGLVRVRVNPLPEGTRLTVMSITDEKNNSIDFNNWGGGGNGETRFSLQNMGDAKALNITLAVHRSRYVEFSVAPPKK